MKKPYIRDIIESTGCLILIGLLMSSIMLPNPELFTDLTKLGGDLTSDFSGRAAIQVNAPNVTDESRRIKQLNGFGLFHSSFIPSTGLGPHFVNSSCAGCHIENGKGPLKFTKSKNSQSTLILKTSLKGLDPNRAPIDVPGLGEQLLDSTLEKTALGSAKIQWQFTTGRYPDGTSYKLRKPKLTFKIPGITPRSIVTSLRMTPPVIGPGLLEAIPDQVIMQRHDPFDLDGDGISGRINHIHDIRSNTLSIGRFGFKGSHNTVAEQTAAALFFDIGVTNPIFPKTAPASEPKELSGTDFELLVLYQKLAGVPKARNQNTSKVIAGKRHFLKVDCEKCHRMTMTTNEYRDPELSNQTFHPFTDLLLHDMGSGLADKRSEYSAKGSEWKTTPLWGLGFARRLTKRKVAYLHDGRARTVEEAILWHGGEAAKSKKKFMKLSKEERDELLAFLDSL